MIEASAETIRLLAAKKAIETIRDHVGPETVIGVGTGSTVDCFVKQLKASDLKYKYCVSSSGRTSKTLADNGIKEEPLKNVDHVDFYIDGIDEGLDNGVTVKGGAGALTREKVVATMSRTFVTIAGNDRKVSRLGVFPIPIEVMPYAVKSVIKVLTNWGGEVTLRDGFITDYGNYILDVSGLDTTNPKVLEKDLNTIPGVIDNGVFAHRLADVMIYSDGIDARIVSPNEIIVATSEQLW